MPRPAVKEAGRSLRRRMQEEAARQHRPLRYAEITRVRPLTAELTDGNLVLDEDDLTIGKWVQQYKRNYGLKVGDTLAVQLMHNGDWFVSDVLNDRRTQKFKHKKGTGPKEGGEGSEAPETPEEEEPQPGEEAAEEEEEGVNKAEIKGWVEHGEDANKARPEGYGSVEWLGTVEPVNALDGDTWINPPTG